MTHRALAVAALLAGAGAGAAIAREGGETRVVPPLAAPGVEPGIARCTSDGVCLVTDADGRRRAAARVTLAP